MRRKTAVLLAALLALQLPVTSAASAANVGVPRTETEPELPESGTAESSAGRQEEPTDTPDPKPAGDGTGTDGQNADISLVSEATPADAAVPMRINLERMGSLKIDIQGVVTSPASDWLVELYPAGQSWESGRIAGESAGEAEKMAEAVLPALSLEREETDDEEKTVRVQTAVLIEDIPAGTYDLRMVPSSADESSYLPYEQKGLVIGENLVTLHLMNDDPRQHGAEEDAAKKYGVLSMGDINHDQVLDEADQKLLMEMIAMPDHSHDVYFDRADMNRDGVVNILDMAAFARYYENDAASQKAVPVMQVLIRTDEISEIASSEETDVSGSLEKLITGSGGEGEQPLQLKNKNAAITEETPVEITAGFAEPKQMAGFVIDPVPGSDGSIRNGTVTVETVENGGTAERTYTVINGEVQPMVRTIRGTFAMAVATDGQEMRQGVPIVIDLDGQVAVKKITIKVTKTMSGGSLAEISDVEFYGDMADRIPQAPMSVPERVVVDNASEAFTLTWKKMPNVTGYEVKVTGVNSRDETKTTTDVYENVQATSLEVTKMGDAKLVNGKSYEVEISSLNGTWRSQPARVTAAPRAMSLPPAPENLEIQPGYRRLVISWKKMKDTDEYSLYYREVGASGSAYQKAEGIRENKYDLTGLKDETEYEFYLTGINPIGEGPASIHYRAKTISLNAPETPNYKLINTEVKDRDVTDHVVSVQYYGAEGHEFDVVDGRYDTSWSVGDWDAGNSYPADNKAPIVTLDAEYKMDTIVLIPDEAQTFELTGARLQYWTADGTKTQLPVTMRKRISSNNKLYYMFQTAEPFTAQKVQLLPGNAYGFQNRISIAELKFYYYDPLEHEIMDLYTDNYHVVLREDVTLTDIGDLRKKLLVADTVSGELHPRKTELERELDNAEKILKDGNLQADILQVDTKDTVRSDGHITFRGGLNTYQPLGVTALAGETVTVYVGGHSLRNGDTTRLELIVSQYHGSSKAVFKSMGYLQGGVNEITIPALDSMDLERGGQLYVEYTGDAGGESYGVRVSGGRKSAVLDLSDVTDVNARVELAKQYLADLEKQNRDAEALHEQDHGKFTWDPKNCIYQATDIVTRYGMISTAAQQVFAGLGSGSADERAAKLEQSMRAFDEMMVLFYQHKGLSSDPDAESWNRMPASRINIRYQRMFAGAFMYAGGKHIGIEWPELAGMMGGVPMQTDADGRYQGTGQYFGWGISHEIGHEINEGTYAIAEVTNNYFAVLAQAHDDNKTVRYDYDDVFAKVTSGTSGKAANVFVQLAMYWQLHLAYDLDGYNYKTYDSSEEQLANRFFARVDSYVRHPESAPGTEGNELVLTSADTDNKLMRLAVAASQKNILGFFRRWGLTPDQGTIWYASQFEEETRGIWFANDDSRVVQIENGPGQNKAKDITVGGTIDYTYGSNEVKLNLTASSDDIWMYEIYRYERVKDAIERRPVGYARAEGGGAVFTDVIGTINNHTFTYEIVGYDQWLNPTEKKEIGSVKVSHDGQLDSSLWEISTNMTNSKLEAPNADHPDTTFQPGMEDMIDHDVSTSFTGSTAADVDPEIVISLNQEETITGLTYQAVSGTAISDFEIYVSLTGSGDWQKVTAAEHRFALQGGKQTVYFHNNTNLFTYDASYVRLVAKGQGGREITVTELSLIGQTGDDIILDNENSIGILASEYKGSSGETIPAGSMVFTGKYKGHPAFNVVLLYDENGRIVGGTDEDGTIHAKQIIFAPAPEGDGLLGEVSSGTWVYYIEPQYVSSVTSKKVRAELYRVDDAETNEGERLVSSTMFVDIPPDRPGIEIRPGG